MTTLRKLGDRGFTIPVSGAVYIETGLDNGNSMANALTFPFEKVIGIEINHHYAGLCRRRFSGDSRVEIITGDSAEVLPRVIDPGRKTVFFLDAHWCEAYRGEERRQSALFGPCVLLRELRAIADAPWRVKPTVIIDDAVAFCSRAECRRDQRPGSRPGDYPTFQEIYDTLGGPEGAYNFAVIREEDGGVIYCF